MRRPFLESSSFYFELDHRIYVFSNCNFNSYSKKICSFHLSTFLFSCCVGVQCDIYKCSQNTSNISYLNSLPPPFYFISLPPIPGTLSTVLIVPFTYMCTQYLYYIHTPHTFYPSHWYQPPQTGRDETIQVRVQICMEMSQGNSLYSYLKQ
jgi:hypothetical protein